MPYLDESHYLQTIAKNKRNVIPHGRNTGCVLWVMKTKGIAIF